MSAGKTNPVREGASDSTHFHFLWRMVETLRVERFNGWTYAYPTHVARWMGCTRLEAELGLRLLIEQKAVVRRNCGRFYLDLGVVRP